jgi:glycosyltransferase involved in cell wall biosynthesis
MQDTSEVEGGGRPTVRVLHVIPGLARRTGGPALIVVAVARAIRGVGGENMVYTTNLRDPAGTRSRARVSAVDLPSGLEELDVAFFPVRYGRRLAYAPELGRALRTDVGDFTVVHIHSLFLYPQFAAFRAARDAGVPYIVTLHGALDPALRSRHRFAKTLADKAWQRRMLDGAAAIHFTTEAERDLTADLGLRAPGVVIPNGIDWASFQRAGDPERWRDRNGGASAKIILFLGRLTYKKGLEILIPAVAKLAGADPSVHLVIAGPDDEGMRPRLESQAERLGLAGRIHFSGLLNDEERLDALSGCDVWVLPSKSENFGTTVIEAMACGAPVIMSPAVNLAPEAGRAGAAKIVERDPAELARALRELLDDDVERARLSACGREFSRGFDWAAIAPRLFDFYSGVSHG